MPGGKSTPQRPIAKNESQPNAHSIVLGRKKAPTAVTVPKTRRLMSMVPHSLRREPVAGDAVHRDFGECGDSPPPDGCFSLRRVLRLRHLDLHYSIWEMRWIP